MFRLDDEENGTSTIISRKGDRQREQMGDEKKMLLKVVWLNDCTYTLQRISRHKGKREKSQSTGLDPNIVLKVRILETGEDHYIQRTTCASYDLVLETRMTLIKKR